MSNLGVKPVHAAKGQTSHGPLELEQIIGHQPWLHEWQQVPTRKHVGFDAEPVSSDPALQADREETVVVAG
jgi:hypothetical protein